MNYDTIETGLNRRDVLKSAALLGAVGAFGVGSFAVPARAATTITPFEIYALEHNNQGNAADEEGGQTDRDPDRLLVIDSTTLSSGDITAPIEADYYDIVVEDSSGEPLSGVQLNTATLAAGVRASTSDAVVLYGIHRGGTPDGTGGSGDSQPFSITVPGSGTTATATLFGSTDAALKDIYASAIDASGTWYGVNQSDDSLYTISLASGSEGDLSLVGNFGRTVSNVGMGINFLTDDLWAVLGDQSAGEQSDVITVSKSDGSTATVGDSVLTDGRLVGAAFGPCANVLYVVRNGNELYGYDVSDNSELEFGTIQYTIGGEVTRGAGVDNLAVPYGYECEEEEECVPCDLEESLKYEYVFEEDGDDEDSEPDVDGFVPEDAPDAFGFDGYDSKDGEEYEPVTVYFDNPGNYCADSLVATVKAGRIVEEVEVTEGEDGQLVVSIDGDERFVNDKNGKVYAISYIEFECADEPDDPDDSDDPEPEESRIADSDDDGDDDRGHGNDDDGDDEDNPGKGGERGNSAGKGRRGR